MIKMHASFVPKKKILILNSPFRQKVFVFKDNNHNYKKKIYTKKYKNYRLKIKTVDFMGSLVVAALILQRQNQINVIFVDDDDVVVVHCLDHHYHY
jgi:hypothetical protein